MIAKCAEAMRAAASQIDRKELEQVVKTHGRPEGDYKGGLVSSAASHFLLISLKFISAILWAPGAIHITHSTSQRLHPS